MTENNNHIFYSKADIENYLQGKMSYETMHKLELDALQDPFLADAIEGYNNTNFETTTQHLKDIETQILSNNQETKIVALSKKNKLNYLKIAASIIAIIGVGLITNLVLKNNNKNAITEKSVAINNIKTDKTIVDTVQKLTNPKTDETIASKGNTNNKNENLSKQNYNTPANNLTTITQLDTIKTPLTQKENIAIATTTFASNNYDKKEIDARDFKALSKDSIAANLYYANVETGKLKNVRRSGYSNDNATQNVIALAPIKMKIDTSYKPIAATALGTKRKNIIKNTDYKFTKEDSLTMPVNGWDDFNNYVKNSTSNITITDTTKGDVVITNSRTGEAIVDLEFTVDINGNPEKIKVINSTNEANNNKAIKLLENGPKWKKATVDKNNKKQKAKVSIKFNK